MTIDFNKMKVTAEKKIKVMPVLANMTVGKPSKTTWFRIRHGEGWEAPELYTFTPDNKSKDSQPYLVMEDYQQIFEEKGVLVPAKFYMYVVFGSNVMKVDLISQKLDKSGGRSRYHVSREECYEAAKTHWIQMQSNESGGFYTWSLAQSVLPEPIWPDKPANIFEAIELAFKDHIINDINHPEIKNLRGII